MGKFSLPFFPIPSYLTPSLAISGLAGLVVSLDDLGHLMVSYLGTDPSTSVVNVAPENKVTFLLSVFHPSFPSSDLFSLLFSFYQEFNYDDMDEELRRLQAIIREATTGNKVEPTDHLIITPQETHQMERVINLFSSLPSIFSTVLISLSVF